IECYVSGGERNLFLLTHEVTADPGTLHMRVRLGRLEEDTVPPGPGFGGFRAGIRGQFNDYRDSALYGVVMKAGPATHGRLCIGKRQDTPPRVTAPLQNLELLFEAEPSSSGCRVRLAVADSAGKLLAETTRDNVPSRWLTGGVALVSSAGRVEDSPDPASVI